MLLAGNFSGCEPEDWLLQINCDDCFGYSPDSANLVVYLTIDEENDSIPLTFYRGSFDEGEIDWQDTATTEEFYLFSAMEQEYTVRARYKSGNDSIFAFDGDKMTIYDAWEECGDPCYMVKGGIFDLRLVN
jgi:hypothetical protein